MLLMLTRALVIVPIFSEKRAVMSLLSQKEYVTAIGSTVHFADADVGSGWSPAGAEE
jgi:hypothetical protein